MASLSLSKSPCKKSKRAGDKPGDEAVASSGENTREYRTIQRHYSNLVDNLGKTVDPAHFAIKLRERSLISEDIVEAASVVGVLTGSQRIAPVISAVLAQIKLKAKNFHLFITILKAENSCLADTISQYYASSLELHALRVLESVSEWEELGHQLNVGPEKLLQLSQCGRDPNYCKEKVVSEWLEGDKGASWKKLCSALEQMGSEAEASEIREQYISQCHDAVPPATSNEAELPREEREEFVNPLPNDSLTECPICFEILREPITVSCCGNSFCRECLEKVQASGRTTCPLCQHHASEFTPAPEAEVPREEQEEFVDLLPNDPQTECPICRHVVQEPIIVTVCCRNSFCRECIEEVYVRGGLCPLCRASEFMPAPEGELQLERPDQEPITPSRRSPCRHLCYVKFCVLITSAVLLIPLLALLTFSPLLNALLPDHETIHMQVAALIYEEEAVLITQLDSTVQSVNISESVSNSTDAHIISLYGVTCDRLNYTNELIADTINANYSGGDIVPIQEFSYYANGSLVNLSIFVSCQPMPCSELSSVSFVFFTDYNEHLSFQDGSPLESLDYYTVEQTQLLSHPSLVSVLINSTEYYFVDLVLPKEDSLTYTVSLNITGTRSYLNAEHNIIVFFCTLSPSNPSCTFERINVPDDIIYCIWAYVLGQSTSSEISRFANVIINSVLNIPSSSRVYTIFLSVLLPISFLIAVIMFTSVCCIVCGPV